MRKIKKTEIRKDKAITLIALVITIIVLLILAGVSIAMLTGENGILNQAQEAKKANEEATSKEKKDLEIIQDQLAWTGNINQPKLSDGMKAVYWEEENGVIREVKQGEANYKENKWYHYAEGDNQIDSKTSKWANAITEKDGSYWVWIPRYEYKIISDEGTNNTGKIEVKFISTMQTQADEGYKIHPAFTTNIDNGGWDKELAGIWVAKYEAGGEDENGNNIQPGDINQLSTTVKLVTKPNVSSWRTISSGNSYTVSYEYDREKDSHMMKNSEWGAVVYLAHSQYGRNGNEITINNSSDYITGNAGDSITAEVASGITNPYDSEKGMLASTTGNIYGIYDMSGGAWERTASFIANNNNNLKTNGGSYACDENGNFITKSTKYVTVYPYDLNSDNNANNYNIYKESEKIRYGDAILETSSIGNGSRSWFGDSSYYPYTNGPFFMRGGYYSDTTYAGMFNFYNTYGAANNGNSFRVVLAF